MHTLAGTSGTVGFSALRDLAQALETTFEMLVDPVPVLSAAQYDVFDAVLARVRQMLQAFGRDELAGEQPDMLAELDALREALSQQQAAAAYGDAGPDLARHLDDLFAQAYDSLIAEPPAAPPAAPSMKEEPAAAAADPFDFDMDALFDTPPAPAQEEAPAAVAAEAAAQAEAQPEPEPESEPETHPEAVERPLALATEAGVLAAEPVLHDELDSDLLPVFLEEAADLLPQIGNGLRQWQHNPQDPAPAQGLLRTLHTVKGSARMAGAMRIGQHTHELETQVENMVHAGTTAPAAFDELMASYDTALALFEQLVQPAQAAQVVREIA